MNKHYVREEYDEPDVTDAERTLAPGWWIAAAMIYAVGLVASFVLGYLMHGAP